MSKLNVFAVLGLVSISVMSSVKADGGAGIGGSAPKESPISPILTPSLTWEQFKDSCLHPEQFHNQVPPSNIRIQCTNIGTRFVNEAPGSIPVPTTNKIIVAIYSNKYHVNAEERSYPIVTKGASCIRYKEVVETMTIEKNVTCNEILGIKSDLAEFCGSNLAGAKSSNPKLVDQKSTGRFVDTCSGKVGILSAAEFGNFKP